MPIGILLCYSVLHAYKVILLIERTIGCTSLVVCRLCVLCTECCPSLRTEYSVAWYIVHIYRNTKHRSKCNKFCTFVAVDCYAVVSAPISHYAVYILECTLTCKSRNKPCCRPCSVCTLVDCVMDFIRKVYRITLSKLKNRTDTVDNINSCLLYTSPSPRDS